MDESEFGDNGPSTSTELYLDANESADTSCIDLQIHTDCEEEHDKSASSPVSPDSASLTGRIEDPLACDDHGVDGDDENGDGRDKLVIDDTPSQLESPSGGQRFGGSIFYSRADNETTVYVLDELPDEVSLQDIWKDLGCESVVNLNDGCADAPDLVNVVRVHRRELSDSAGTKSSAGTTIRHYKAYNFGGDYAARSKNIPSCPDSAERILMCLPCQLSFDATKPFVNHAVLRHQQVLLKEGEELVNTTNSAILQSKVGLLFLVPTNTDAGQGNVEMAGNKDSNFSKEQDGRANENTMETKEKEESGEEQNRMDKKTTRAGEVVQGDPAEMSPADIARTVMLASELSASRLLQQVSQNVREYGNWGSTSSSPDVNKMGAFGTPTGCGVHCGTSGRSNAAAGGVECPKCDVVLGSSRSLGGHMTMTHSRNSCKTLKCPKCNWHYKYPETLEIHMKEKHPDNEVNCVYCITNQAHPRLSRGETYTCGYKPFRCEVCKYSTTTKGNLSIHMQSDKHLNNVQELQQGRLMAQAQAPGSLAVLGFGTVTDQGTTPAAVQLTADTESTSVNTPEMVSGLPSACGTTPIQKIGAVTKQKPSWRCDVCNYETNVARNLRIHMTSEKHAYNMGVLQRSVKQLQQTIQEYATGSSSGSLATGTQQASFPVLPAFTPGPIAKDAFPAAPQHQQLLHSSPTSYLTPALSQHAFSGQLEAASAFSLQAALLQRAVENGNIFQCCVCMTFSGDNTDDILNHIQRDRSQPADGDVAIVGGQYYCNLCAYRTHLKANFQLHTKTDKHLQRLQLVNHVREGCQENQWRLKYLNPNNPVQLRCCACNHLVNSFHKLQMHTATLRHKCFVRAYRRIHQADEEWRRTGQQEQQQEQQIFYCSLCDCGARTKNGMLSHLHSTLHGENVNRLGPLMDMSDGGGSCGESDTADWVVVKPAGELENVQMVEHSPDNTGSNLDIGRMNECPETSRSILNFAWHNDRGFGEGEEFHSVDEVANEGDSTAPESSNELVHYCSRCSSVYETQAELSEHYATKHGTLKTERDMAFEEIRSSTGGQRASDGNCSTAEDSMNCDGNTRAKERTNAVDNAGTNCSTVPCPLCQKECGRETNELEGHLIKAHSVSVEAVHHLLSLIPSSNQSSVCSDSSPTDCPERPSSTASSLNSDCGSITDADKQSTFACPSCSVPFTNLDDLYAHQSEVGHMEVKETPEGVGYPCWWKGCNQYFKTVQAIQAHFREIHAKRPNQFGVTSDRHLYRYRCGQCSQAYRTEEKLRQHQVYHQMRAATTCVICSRSFRTLDALKKHVETTHVSGDSKSTGLLAKTVYNSADDEDNDEMEEKLPESPLNTSADDTADGGLYTQPALVIDEKPDSAEDYLNTPAMAEAGYMDANRKFKCHRCKVAFTGQSYLTVHNRTVAHRRGDRVSFNMEKYMDPSRPYKCDICMESFTQKNILLVHKNSVMHISKMKKALDSYPNGNLSVDMLNAIAKSGTFANLGNSSSSSSSAQTSHNQSRSGPSTSTDTKSNSPITTNANKRYKCNTCDTYVTDSTLEIHLRSVKHQSRAAKVVMGADDTTEMDSSSSRPIPTAKEILNEAITKRHLQRSSPANKAEGHNSASASTSAQDAAATAALQTALLSMASFAPFLAAAQAASYQGLPDTSSGTQSATNQCFQCRRSFSSSTQLQNHLEKGCYGIPNEDAKATSTSSSSAIQQALCNSTRVVRSGRGNIFKRLLEDYGFEVVMQFNEMQPQKRSKSVPADGIDGMAITDGKTEMNSTMGSETKLSTGKGAIPEVTKCVCPQCGATFSSVWVLKAHCEHTHGTIVPLDFVEETSEEFKQAYEKKYSLNCGGDAEQQETQQPSTKSNPAGNENRSGEGGKKGHQGATNQQQGAVDSGGDAHAQHQQQQQLLALNAMMQQFSAAAHFPAMASNSTLAVAAAAMGMSQFPFMNVPFAPFGVSNPFLPMMVPPGLDQLAFGAASSTVTSSTSGVPLSSTIAPNAASASPFVSAAAAMGSSMPPIVSASQQQPKRARTRITDDQLKILREYFDINNSPTEEQIEEMSRKSGLPLKVIKHWFRNTLFKERQRCKDSPYNFSIPPSYSIDLEEYEKTGEAKIIALNPNGEPATSTSIVPDGEKEPSNSKLDDASSGKDAGDANTSLTKIAATVEKTVASIKIEGPNGCDQINGDDTETTGLGMKLESEEMEENSQVLPKAQDAMATFDGASAEEALRQMTASALGALSMQFPSRGPSFSSFLGQQQTAGASAPTVTSQVPSNSTAFEANSSFMATSMSPSGQGISNQSSRRANRTRFTECQIKTLQEFFEKNAYPKDDDLEYLSQKLSLSPRVIVVWFQNARQKARKIYENQPPESDERFHRTPGLNYQCKVCKLVFQRYYELIKHQKTDCYKEEGGGDFSACSTPTSSTSTTPKILFGQHPRSGSPSGDGGKGENEFRCVQCAANFSDPVEFSEHLKLHTSGHFASAGDQNSRKRALTEGGSGDGDSLDATSSDQDSASAKRPRTQILPEQLDALYKKYTKDANPSSRNLEKIAQETGLNKRVVQVWFQNTRARERRGQLNDRQFFNKRCPFCGILHHSKQTMEAHLNSRHAAQLGKTEIDIDSLPDAEEVPTITTVAVPDSLIKEARSSGVSGNDLTRSMLSFGMVPGTTTVPAPGRPIKSSQDSGAAGHSATAPLDLSRAVKMQNWELGMSEKAGVSGLEYENIRSSSHRTPSNGNSNEEAMSMDEFEDSRSICDQDSPSPHQQVLAALARPQKRFRTHLTAQQVKVMKHLFQDYKTPTMAECETLGQEIGLHKRVVQVWFQNARAKERKTRVTGGESVNARTTASPLGVEMKMSSRCDLCSVTYTSRTTMQDHLFCKDHLVKVKAIVDNEEDGLRISSPKPANEPCVPLTDNSARSSRTQTSSVHLPRTQQKQQQHPQKRQQQQQQSLGQDLPSSSTATSAAQNFLPYMYAGALPQAYYASLASSMMYSGAFTGMAGMYDPNIHGTPVSMLQIPATVMKTITSTMGRARESSCRFTQDGHTVTELSRAMNARDRACLVPADLEVGWACRRCTTVFQTEALFLNHQRVVCQSKEPAFKLIQTHYECRVCGNRFGTQDGFKAHCQSTEHVSKLDACQQ